MDIGDVVRLELPGNPFGLVLAVRNPKDPGWRGFENPLLPGYVSILVLEDSIDQSFISQSYLRYAEVDSRLSSRVFQVNPRFCGPPLDLAQRLKRFRDRNLTEIFALLRLEAVRDFDFEGRDFLVGQVGTTSGFCHGRKDLAFQTIWPVVGRWNLPLSSENLRFCDAATGFSFAPFPGTPPEAAPKLQPGDIAVVRLPKSIKSYNTTERQNGERVRLHGGDVFQFLGRDPKNTLQPADTVKVLSGPYKGYKISLGRIHFDLLKHPFFEEGKSVKIKDENILFRRQSLKGLTARVLIPTDQDGDVGLQFEEDLGAGSLDGIGVDGRCLFVPAKHLT